MSSDGGVIAGIGEQLVSHQFGSRLADALRVDPRAQPMAGDLVGGPLCENRGLPAVAGRVGVGQVVRVDSLGVHQLLSRVTNNKHYPVHIQPLPAINEC